MSERAPYSRVYWSVIEDPKFDGIRENLKLFGAWSLMLLVADMAHPAPAYPPQQVPPSALKALVDCGLVDMLSGGRFYIHGLKAERDRRSHAAQTGGKREATGHQTGGKREATGPLDKTRLDETSRDTARDPADIYWQLTTKYPTQRTLEWVDALTGTFGAEPVIRHLVEAHIADSAVSTLLGRTQDRLRAEARQLDQRERSEEEARLREKRAIPRPTEPWREEFRKAIQAQYDDIGGAA